MVIQCSACQTRYRLAEEKIKPQGSKVRCSKCGEVFTALPPAPAPEPAPLELSIEDLLTAAPGAEAGPAAAGAVLPDDDDDHDWKTFEVPGGKSAATPPLTEDDFEIFPAKPPHGPPVTEEFSPGPTAATAEDEFFFESAAGEAETGGFTFEEESVEEEEVTFEVGPSSEEEFSLNGGAAENPAKSLSFLEFDALSFDDEPSKDRFTEEDSAAGLGIGVRDELTFEESEVPAPPPPAPEADEDAFFWGEPADEAAALPGEFDFGSDSEDFSGPGGDELDFDLPDFPTDESAASPAPAAAAASAAASEPPVLPSPPPLSPAPILPTERSRYARHRRKSGASLLTWLVAVILLGLCAAMGYFYWLGEFPDVNRLLDRFMPPAATAPAASKIRVTELNGFFLNNTEAGQLFVVRGQAVNDYSEPRSAMAVKGRLFNRAGNLLRERSAYCGNSLSEGELKSLPLAKLRERSENQFGDSLSNLNVAPGKSVPFTIVFSNLPSDLAEFTVEPGDSIPGSKQ